MLFFIDLTPAYVSCPSESISLSGLKDINIPAFTGSKTLFADTFCHLPGSITVGGNGLKMRRHCYYEVTLTKKSNANLYFSVGYTTSQARLEGFSSVGWRAGSWGIHTEQGSFYSQRAQTMSEGVIPAFEEGTCTIGIGILYDDAKNSLEKFSNGGDLLQQGTLSSCGDIFAPCSSFVSGGVSVNLPERKLWPEIDDLLSESCKNMRRRLFVTFNGEFKGFLTQLEAHAGGLPIYPAVSIMCIEDDDEGEGNDDDNNNQHDCVNKQPATAEDETLYVGQISFSFGGFGETDKFKFDPDLYFPFFSRPPERTPAACIHSLSSYSNLQPLRDDTANLIPKIRVSLPPNLFTSNPLEASPLKPSPHQWSIRFNHHVAHSRDVHFSEFVKALTLPKTPRIALVKIHPSAIERVQFGLYEGLTVDQFLKTTSLVRSKFPRLSLTSARPENPMEKAKFAVAVRNDPSLLEKRDEQAKRAAMEGGDETPAAKRIALMNAQTAPEDLAITFKDDESGLCIAEGIGLSSLAAPGYDLIIFQRLPTPLPEINTVSAAQAAAAAVCSSSSSSHFQMKSLRVSSSNKQVSSICLPLWLPQGIASCAVGNFSKLKVPTVHLSSTGEEIEREVEAAVGEVLWLEFDLGASLPPCAELAEVDIETGKVELSWRGDED